MKLKKYLIISSVFPPEPVVSANISFALANELKNYGEVTVIAPFPTRPKGFNFVKQSSNLDSTFGFKIQRIKSFTSPSSNPIGRLLESISFGLASYHYICKNKKHLCKVYLNTWPLFAQYFAALACKKNNIEFVVHVQDIYPESLINKIKNRIVQKIIFKALVPFDYFVLNKANSVITISDKMKVDLIETRGINPLNTFTVINWQNNNNNFKSKPSDSIFKFMYLGNIGPVAGVKFLIISFKMAELPNAQLIIAGSGSKKEECQTFAKKIGLTNIFFKDVDDGKVAEVQSEADILLLPIIKGGAMSSVPSKLMSYMFSGKPIIATLDQDSETFSVMNNSNAGWCGPAENTDWLASTLKYTQNLPKEILLSKGYNGYLYAKSNFDEKINLSKLVNIVK